MKLANKAAVVTGPRRIGQAVALPLHPKAHVFALDIDEAGPKRRAKQLYGAKQW